MTDTTRNGLKGVFPKRGIVATIYMKCLIVKFECRQCETISLETESLLMYTDHPLQLIVI